MGTKVPGYERSQEVPRNFRSPGTKVPENERVWERKFQGTFVPRERKVPGTKVPGTLVPGERKFSIGTFRSWERKVSGSKSL